MAYDDGLGGQKILPLSASQWTGSIQAMPAGQQALSQLREWELARWQPRTSMTPEEAAGPAGEALRALNQRQWAAKEKDAMDRTARSAAASEGRYCLNCRWSKVTNWGGTKRLMCRHPRVPEFERGALEVVVNDMRIFRGRCDSDAKWFEPKAEEKVGFWRRLFS